MSKETALDALYQLKGRESCEDVVDGISDAIALLELGKTKSIWIYNQGYMSGHHDTAESQFTDVHRDDMWNYHDDIIDELLADYEPAPTKDGDT